jgi:hypothetical protein
MVKLNKKQRLALYRKWVQSDQGKTYKQFRKSVVPGPNCVMVPWCNMWIGIETDGYTHS